MLKKFIKVPFGVTAIEYVLIVAAMALALVLVLVTVMPKITKSLKTQFTKIDTHIKTGK